MTPVIHLPYLHAPREHQAKLGDAAARLDHCLAALIFLLPRLQAEEQRRELVRGDALKHRAAGQCRQVL